MNPTRKSFGLAASSVAHARAFVRQHIIVLPQQQKQTRAFTSLLAYQHSKDTSSSSSRRVHTQEPYPVYDEHAQEIDRSLFEEESTQYSVYGNDVQQSSTRTNDAQRLLALTIKDGNLDKATQLLEEMQKLQTDIEPWAGFLRIALHYARKGQFDHSMKWVKLSPSRTLCNMHLRSAVERYLGRILYQLQAAEQFQYACNTLLLLSRSGFLATKGDLYRTYRGTLSWLMEYAYHDVQLPTGQPFAEWSAEFFRQLCTLGKGAPAGDSGAGKQLQEPITAVDSAETLSSQFAAQSNSKSYTLDSNFHKNMVNTYNICIRALCRGHRFDAAIKWIAFDSALQLARKRDLLLPRLHVTTYTMNTFLKYALKAGLDEQLQKEYQSLWLNISDATEKFPIWSRLVRLKELMDVYSGQTPAQMIFDHSNIEREVIEAHHNGQFGKAQTLLYEAIMQHDFRPPASLLALTSPKNLPINGQASKIDEHVPGDSGRTKLLVSRQRVISLQRRNSHVEALQVYFANFWDPHLRRLTEQILAPRHAGILGNITFGDEIGSRLDVNSTSFALGLQSLINTLGDDADALDNLYATWLASIAVCRKTSDAPLSNSGLHIRRIIPSQACIVDRPIPPQKAHFVSFIRSVPRAYTKRSRRALRKGVSLATVDAMAHGDAIDRAITIVNDMQAFGLHPSQDALTLLLDALIRNLDLVRPLDRRHDPLAILPNDDGTLTQWQRIEGIMRLLHIPPITTDDKNANGAKILSSSDASTAQQDACTPSPLCYSFIIRALLSVPERRGGPLLSQAETVMLWLNQDEQGQHELRTKPHRYAEQLEKTASFLQNVRKQHAQRTKEPAYRDKDRSEGANHQHSPSPLMDNLQHDEEKVALL